MANTTKRLTTAQQAYLVSLAAAPRIGTGKAGPTIKVLEEKGLIETVQINGWPHLTLTVAGQIMCRAWTNTEHVP